MEKKQRYKRKPRRRARVMKKPAEPGIKTADGAYAARYAGVCWLCGKDFPEGTLIRFLQRETVHDGECWTLAMGSFKGP